MALVDYGDSDASDYEDEEETSVPVLSDTIVPTLTVRNTTDASADHQGLFSLLPQPTSKKAPVIEEDDEFLHKKETVTAVKPKARITVPSLNDFKDVESTPVSKIKEPSEKKSGLLSLLPEPKGSVISTSTSFMPHVLTKKPPTQTVKKKTLPTPITKKVEAAPLAPEHSDDSENDDEVQNDFFSIHKQVETPIEDLPIEAEIRTSHQQDVPQSNGQKESKGVESYFKADVSEIEDAVMEDHTEYAAQEHYEAGASSSNDIALDDEALRQLCGTRGARRRGDITLVDVDQREVLAGARERLLKGLMDDTTQRVSASKRRGHEPTSQQKRKHQITYLAHQAKANEAELQNQWANGRMNKRKAQSKYGF